MNLKKSLLTALLSFGIVQSTLAETDTERFNRALQFIKQQNYSDAFPLFKQLAEQGDANAQHNLGVMYENGNGITQNDQQAVYWYTKAAEQGEAHAQNNLGLMYTDGGKGITQNYKQAVYWYTQAAEQGDANAQHNLGVMYENGQSVQRNVSKAKQYYRLACDNGLNIGCQTYAKLDKKGIK
ncbi:sel1 repeat family protein [Histophilus somni]|uniref:tetratricopeptide repeat protein n=1 Tax=Histophilus somni TaxID=731 RepID=UPI0018EB53D1|nr:tetratricopeptide repeat protein [Histophilus somni]QQF85977.1 sel1 repeat family protein [Histophilus somni]